MPLGRNTPAAVRSALTADDGSRLPPPGLARISLKSAPALARIRERDGMRENAAMMKRPVPPEFWAKLKEEELIPADAPAPE